MCARPTFSARYMVFLQDRLLNGALPPTGFPFVSSLVAAPIGRSSINPVSFLLGARFAAGFLVREPNRGAPPHTPPIGRTARPFGVFSNRARHVRALSPSPGACGE